MKMTYHFIRKTSKNSCEVKQLKKLLKIFIRTFNIVFSFCDLIVLGAGHVQFETTCLLKYDELNFFVDSER